MDRPIESEEAESELQGLVETIGFVFGIQLPEEEEPEVHDVVIPTETLEILNTMDKYLPNLIILYSWMYEFRNPEKPVVVDQYTVERFFYSCHALHNLYPLIEKSQDELDKFYAILNDKFSKDKDVPDTTL